jgi:DNA-binding IclR family transcriptional regulator
MSINHNMFTALNEHDGPMTETQLRKALDLPEEDVQAALADWQERGWVEVDDSTKTAKYTLSKQGRENLRFPA